MIEYKYVKVDPAYDDYEDCDSCNQVAPLHTFAANPMSDRKEDKKMCELCSSTFVGNALDYPRQYPDAKVMQHICAVGNVMLDKITGREPGKVKVT